MVNQVQCLIGVMVALALLVGPVQVFGADANFAGDGEFTDPMLRFRDFGWTSAGSI